MTTKTAPRIESFTPYASYSVCESFKQAQRIANNTMNVAVITDAKWDQLPEGFRTVKDTMTDTDVARLALQSTLAFMVLGSFNRLDANLIESIMKSYTMTDQITAETAFEQNDGDALLLQASAPLLMRYIINQPR